MDKLSNELIGYIALFIGVVVGWLLCWLWRSMRDRRGKWTILVKEKITLIIEYAKKLERTIQKKQSEIQALQRKIRRMEREKK